MTKKEAIDLIERVMFQGVGYDNFAIVENVLNNFSILYINVSCNETSLWSVKWEFEHRFKLAHKT